MRQDTPSDLHTGFRDPGQAAPADLAAFLQHADQLPGLRPIRAAIREALAPWPGARLLDAGCGIGLEAARLADDYPDLQVTGMDQNATLITTARQRADSQHPNLTWLHADLTDPALPEHAFDLIRTERVLMYFPGASFGQAVDALVRQLRPGGRMACFELDYGATILAPGPDEELDRELAAALERSLPQPWAGRRLPEMLAERGLTEVTANPYAFAVSEPVWRAIVLTTLRTAADADQLRRAAIDQLDAQSEAAGDRPFLASFCGILTTARKPG